MIQKDEENNLIILFIFSMLLYLLTVLMNVKSPL